MRRRFFLCALLMLCIVVSSKATLAQWPEKPIRILVPNAPGGPSDSIARRFGEKLATILAQPVVVDNNGGGGGRIAIELASKSAPDGYTLLLGTNSSFANGVLDPKSPIKPLEQLEPVQLLATNPYVIAVPAGGAKDLRALLAATSAAKATIGFAGLLGNAAVRRFFRSMTPVPYRGVGDLMPALESGQITAALLPMSAVLSHEKSGKVRVLAIFSGERSALRPDVPTSGEAGGPGVLVHEWYGLFVPRGTPSKIIERIAQETGKISRDGDFSNQLQQMGLEVRTMTSENFRKMIEADLKWLSYGALGLGGAPDPPSCPSGQCYCQKQDSCLNDCSKCAFVPLFK